MEKKLGRTKYNFSFIIEGSEKLNGHLRFQIKKDSKIKIYAKMSKYC